MILITAAILFTVYISNVLIGAFFGTPFLSDVGEMLMLFAVSLAFVVVILQREKAAQSRQ